MLNFRNYSDTVDECPILLLTLKIGGNMKSKKSDKRPDMKIIFLKNVKNTEK